MYEFIKSIHLLTVVMFVGTMFFRTFIMLGLKNQFSGIELKKIEQAMGPRARKIVGVSNIILILSGVFLFVYHTNSEVIFLHIKILLGLIAVILFYFVPNIFKKTEHIKNFRVIFHYIFFSLLVSLIFLSQFMYVL